VVGLKPVNRRFAGRALNTLIAGNRLQFTVRWSDYISSTTGRRKMAVSLSKEFLMSTQPQQAPDRDSIAEHLRIFEELDFEAYSKQNWNKFSESHADDILVTYPDGHQTKGLKDHVDELKPQFVFAPDTKIVAHPIKFGTDEWTCVTGVMTGTFTKPMPTPDGKSIPPTGKSFKINMVTIGQWKNGKMIAESFFWDNLDFMKQIGVAK
jgi:hypothetical protein